MLTTGTGYDSGYEPKPSARYFRRTRQTTKTPIQQLSFLTEDQDYDGYPEHSIPKDKSAQDVRQSLKALRSLGTSR